MPEFSPDGHWLAYASDELGNMEVYVRPFPGPGGKWQISTNGGGSPRWSPVSKELFYKGVDDKIMVAAYTASGSAFQADKPRAWSPLSVPNLPGSPGSTFDVGPGGRRFAVLLKSPESQAAAKEDHITFFFNFTDELHRIAPPAKR